LTLEEEAVLKSVRYVWGTARGPGLWESGWEMTEMKPPHLKKRKAVAFKFGDLRQKP
jgi:hypothetical protein